MKAFGEFLFYETGRRMYRSKSLHDILIIAKGGKKKTKIMYAANLSHAPMTRLLKEAEEFDLIEEKEAPPEKRHWRTKPNHIWQTTDKGLRYAKTVYDSFKMRQVIEP